MYCKILELLCLFTVFTSLWLSGIALGCKTRYLIDCFLVNCERPFVWVFFLSVWMREEEGFWVSTEGFHVLTWWCLGLVVLLVRKAMCAGEKNGYETTR